MKGIKWGNKLVVIWHHQIVESARMLIRGSKATEPGQFNPQVQMDIVSVRFCRDICSRRVKCRNWKTVVTDIVVVRLFAE